MKAPKTVSNERVVLAVPKMLMPEFSEGTGAAVTILVQNEDLVNLVYNTDIHRYHAVAHFSCNIEHLIST
jgi:hypothetical protein